MRKIEFTVILLIIAMAAAIYLLLCPVINANNLSGLTFEITYLSLT